MFVYPKKNSTLFSRLLALLLMTLLQSSNSLSKMNLGNILNVNDHIKLKPLPLRTNLIYITQPWNQFCLKTPWHKIISFNFRVTTFFKFDSTNIVLSILLQYAHDFNENLETLYSKLAINNYLLLHDTTKDNTYCLTQLYLTQVLKNLQSIKFRPCNYLSR